jgi:hypothetical protein
MIATRTASVLAGFGLVLSLAACSNDDTAETSAAYCESSAVVQTEVAELRTMISGGSATLEEVQAQVRTIGDASTAAAIDADDLADSVREDVIAADNAFDAAIQAIPSDATVAEAASQYQAAIAAWDAAVLSIRTEAGC